MSVGHRYVSALLLAVAVCSCSKDPQVAKQEHFRNGNAYFAQKKYREASVEYRNAIQFDAKFIEARQKLAETYVNLGDNANAYREVIRIADLLPNDSKAQIAAGEMLLAAQRFEDAITRADKALANTPGVAPALILRGNALAATKRFDQALADVKQAIATDPNSANGHIALGAIEMQQGHRDQAEDALKHAVAVAPQSLQAHLALATFYGQTGRPADAEGEFKAILKVDPANPVANRSLARIFTATGKPANAEAPLKTLAATSEGAAAKLALAEYYVAMHRPDDARQVLAVIIKAKSDAAATAKMRTAELDLAAGRVDQARSAVDEILAKDGKQIDALLVKTEILASEGKLDQALSTARTATTADPRSARAQFLVGRLLAAKHDSKNAETAFSEAAKLDPAMGQADQELARIQLLAGRPDLAQQFALSALRKQPNLVDAGLILARADLVTGKSAEATALLKDLSRALPDSPAVLTELGLLHMQTKNSRDARAAFERAVAVAPTYTNAFNALIRLDLAENRKDLARTHADDAVAKNPQSAAVATLAAKTYIATGDAARAEQALLKGLETHPNDMDTYALLGRLYTSQRRLPDAIKQFEAIAAHRPDSAGVQTTLGVLLEMQGRQGDARARYEKALALDENAAIAANNLAWIYAERGESLDLALQYAQAAKAKLPNRPEVSDTLGWVYYKKALTSLAIPPLEESVAQDPNNPQYHYHLGLAYAGNGDQGKARNALKRALTIQSNFSGAEDARRVLSTLGS